MAVFVFPSRMPKGMHKAAYRGNLKCPVCSSAAVRYIENVTPFRLRYRCRKCGLPFQYDISNRMDIHPYAPFKKSKFQQIVEASAATGRTKKLGGLNEV